jgi:hypothetical protein
MRSSPARSKKTDSDVDEDWDELLADATPPTRPTAHEPPVATPSWRAFEPTPEPRLQHDRVERDESSRRERETTTTTTTTTDSTFAFDGAMHAPHARSNAPNAALRKGWLSDAAAAAERAAELAGEGPMPPPASPPRAEVVEKEASFAEEDTVYSAEASASSPGAFTPRKPPPSPFPSTPQSRDDGRRASPAMDKVAAARRIMAAASPAKRVSVSRRRQGTGDELGVFAAAAAAAVVIGSFDAETLAAYVATRGHAETRGRADGGFAVGLSVGDAGRSETRGGAAHHARSGGAQGERGRFPRPGFAEPSDERVFLGPRGANETNAVRVARVAHFAHFFAGGRVAGGADRPRNGFTKKPQPGT